MADSQATHPHRLKCLTQPDDGSPEELGGLVAELVQQHGPQLDAQLGIAVDGEGRALRMGT